MLEIRMIETNDRLSLLKAEYFNQTTAPLDGMWHFGFVPMAQHFGFYESEQLVGFCCLNTDGYLLQFYVSQQAITSADELFELIIQNNSNVIGKVAGAFVSTCDPAFLAMCLDHSLSSTVNALLYCGVQGNTSQATSAELQQASQEQLVRFVDFAVNAIGAPKDWLQGYFGDLIAKQELFGYWKGQQLIASGECRKFAEHQTEYADLGVIVSPDFRGHGIATDVLRALIALAKSQELIPMCSTEKANLGAQKAIAKAGLVTNHRLLQVTFA
ncbi:GNAT family N-acetyltransferase [uncultured Paraglaciecola sp.]|uniref:GNAT family N-acetyltransferase n=1 Tax=uncultured Paraglaciecola sp. TaxID=1765024 RepID=UPI0025994B61|nr:GNAT family N-acetyltransferase [uncultured Paraglaciecola sp.]